MTLTELKNQALKLPLSEKWYLVQSLLKSIEKETELVLSDNKTNISIKTLEPWTQNLVGVIQAEDKPSQELYINYLEEKYS